MSAEIVDVFAGIPPNTPAPRDAKQTAYERARRAWTRSQLNAPVVPFPSVDAPAVQQKADADV